MPRESFSLKDHLFNEEKVSYLGGLLGDSIVGFDRSRFESRIMARLPELELKERIAHIAVVLADHLAPDFAAAADQIRSSLPAPLDPTLTDDDFGDFIFAPLGKFVEDHGRDHYEISMALLCELTTRFSMEGPVRAFINDRPQQTLQLFEEWARNDHYHVRRLVSEGTRPLLPWAPRIDLDLADPIPLLDILHADPTRYVTRSVANHLNDISKTEPAWAIETLARWRSEGRQSREELEWMDRHALRTLVKRGNPDAMRHLGYSPEPNVLVEPIDLATPVVVAGQALEFTVSMTGLEQEPLIVDYVIDFVKKDGSTSPKVFRLKKLMLESGESTTLRKLHRLRADATTYRLYRGTHRLSILVNGRERASTSFEVETG